MEEEPFTEEEPSPEENSAEGGNSMDKPGQQAAKKNQEESKCKTSTK